MLEREIARIELCYPPEGFLRGIGGALGAPTVEYRDGIYIAGWPVMVEGETAGTYALWIQDPNVPSIAQATYFGLHPTARGIELIAEMTSDGFVRRDDWNSVVFPGMLREPVPDRAQLQAQPETKKQPRPVATLTPLLPQVDLQLTQILEQSRV